MTATVQFSAPASIVLQTAYNFCMKTYKPQKMPLLNSYINPDILTAFVAFKPLASTNCLLTVREVMPFLCELTVQCGYTFGDQQAEGNLIAISAQLIDATFQDLKQQGYIR